jgi:hypothetical protein
MSGFVATFLCWLVGGKVLSRATNLAIARACALPKQDDRIFKLNSYIIVPGFTMNNKTIAAVVLAALLGTLLGFGVSYTWFQSLVQPEPYVYSQLLANRDSLNLRLSYF